MTRTPKTASSTSRGTTTNGVRSRSSSRLETTKPIAPPALLQPRGVVRAGAGGCRWRCARCRGHRSRARSSRPPAGPPGRCARGSRMVRQPTYNSISGTSQPTLPTEPDTTVRAPSMTEPGSCHHTAPATTTASPTTKSPAPSRRCSGSRSRAAPPTLRAAAPTAWADRQPRHGQGPAEGAGRAAGPAPAPSARPGARCARSAHGCARTSPELVCCGWYSGIGCSSRPCCLGTCSCSATPAGKTYGSPC